MAYYKNNDSYVPNIEAIPPRDDRYEYADHDQYYHHQRDIAAYNQCDPGEQPYYDPGEEARYEPGEHEALYDPRGQSFHDPWEPSLFDSEEQTIHVDPRNQPSYHHHPQTSRDQPYYHEPALPLHPTPPTYSQHPHHTQTTHLAALSTTLHTLGIPPTNTAHTLILADHHRTACFSPNQAPMDRWRTDYSRRDQQRFSNNPPHDNAPPVLLSRDNEPPREFLEPRDRVRDDNRERPVHRAGRRHRRS